MSKTPFLLMQPSWWNVLRSQVRRADRSCPHREAASSVPSTGLTNGRKTRAVLLTRPSSNARRSQVTSAMGLRGDFHNHLVPGVDDGSDTLAEALNGIERMVS